MTLTFQHGIPSFATPILTPYGLGLVRRFHEDGTVDLYVGGLRTFTVPSATPWRPANPPPTRAR